MVQLIKKCWNCLKNWNMKIYKKFHSKMHVDIFVYLAFKSTQSFYSHSPTFYRPKNSITCHHIDHRPSYRPTQKSLLKNNEILAPRYANWACFLIFLEILGLNWMAFCRALGRSGNLGIQLVIQGLFKEKVLLIFLPQSEGQGCFAPFASPRSDGSVLFDC